MNNERNYFAKGVILCSFRRREQLVSDNNMTVLSLFGCMRK